MLYVVGGSSISFPGMVAVSSTLLLSSFLSAVKEPHAVHIACWPALYETYLDLYLVCTVISMIISVTVLAVCKVYILST